MTKNRILKKAEDLKEELQPDTLSDAEQFVRRKMARYMIWENHIREHLIHNGLKPKVKVNFEVELEEEPLHGREESTSAAG